jgi:hypothetical protein
MLLSREAWAAVGGFDEDNYPIYFVDVDICAALWHGGWFVFYDPGSVVVHELNGSTTPPLRLFAAERNWARFRQKWVPAMSNREPGPPTSDSVVAAIARAEGWRVSPPWGDRPPPKVARPPIERPAAEYQACEREFQRAYARHLEQHNAALEAAVAYLSQPPPEPPAEPIVAVPPVVEPPPPPPPPPRPWLRLRLGARYLGRGTTARGRGGVP